jgi:hypothetical protein
VLNVEFRKITQIKLTNSAAVNKASSIHDGQTRAMQLDRVSKDLNNDTGLWKNMAGGRDMIFLVRVLN